MKIGMIGVGYVGLVSGTCFAEMGHQVICVDRDPEKIRMLQKGKVPIYEPGLEEKIRENVFQKRLSFTLELREALQEGEVLFVAVGTPPGEGGQADLRQVLQVAREVGEGVQNSLVWVTKSTVPVGTHALLQKTLHDYLERRGVSHRIEIASNPEFLREGSALEDCLNPDRIVLGVETSWAQKLLQRLYQPFERRGCPLLWMDLASAEMTKYAANALLASRISFMNEMSRLCDSTGADIEQVRRGIGSDHRLGSHFLYAGLGYGGSCFPKDVEALLQLGQGLGHSMSFLRAIQEVNRTQRGYFLDKIRQRLNPLEGKKIALWGLSFKPGTDDLREAPALEVLQTLLAEGAWVQAYDPVVNEKVSQLFPNHPRLFFSSTQEEALLEADALCLLTEWSCFHEPPFAQLKPLFKTPLIFDGRNQYDPAFLKELGFEVHSLGRPLFKLPL